MNPVIKPTPMLLAVLTTLYEAPMHPYQMHRLMLERGKELIAEVKPGSIYHAVQRLEKHGLAEAVETARTGRRPERTTYRITEAGRTTCIEWIEGMLAGPKEEPNQFLAALASMAVITPGAAERALAARAGTLEQEIAGHENSLRETTWLPRIVLVETEYLIAVRRAELAWLRRIITEIHSGDLYWDEEQLRAFLATQSTEP